MKGRHRASTPLVLLALSAACLLSVLGCRDPATEDPLTDGGGQPDLGPVADARPQRDGAGPATDLGPHPSDGAPPLDVAPDPGDSALDAGADLPSGCRSDDDCPGCAVCDRQQGVCLPCGCRADADCGEGEICVDAACVSDCHTTGCGPTETCDAELRRCVPRDGCRLSSDCPADTACVEAACVVADPYSDCRAPRALSPGAVVAASTVRARDDYAGGCVRGPSPDVVFHFVLPEPAGVRLRVDGQAARFDPAVYLRSGVCGAGPDLACLDTPFLLREVLELAELPAADYYVFVESFGPAATGDFTIELETFPDGLCVDDRLEDNDVELSAVALELVTGAELVACPGDPDWYSLPLFAGDELVLSVDVEPSDDPLEQEALQAALERLVLRVDDAAGVALPGAPTVEPGRLNLRAGPVGEQGPHRVLVQGPDVDAPDGLRLPHRLHYEVLTDHGTTDCTNPTSLSAERVAHDDTSRGTNDLAGSCCSELQHDAPEIVYKLRLEEESSVDLRVAADWLYALYLRRECAAPGLEDELLCRAPGRIFLPVLEAGTYYVVVDGFGDASGPFELSVALGPPAYPPDNDLCAGAVELLPDLPVEGNTRFATNGSRGSCTAPIGHTGPDVIYRFALEQAGPVRIVLEPHPVEGDPWVPALYLQQQCGDTGSEEACEHLEPGLELELPAGEHFVVVDSWKSDGGPFTLSLELP